SWYVFFQAEDGIRDFHVTGVQTCALPIYGTRLLHHHRHQGGNAVAQLAAVADLVDGTVLEQELAALEALGQGFTDGLLDHPRAGEADQRLRLGDVDVAQHRQRRRHAAGGRMGQYGDIRQPGLAEPP